MRRFVQIDSQAWHEVWLHLQQEFGTSWKMFWFGGDGRCLIPVPRPGTRFDVVESMEVCTSTIREGAALLTGRYEVVAANINLLAQTIRVKHVGERKVFTVCVGRSHECLMDWRGIRKIA